MFITLFFIVPFVFITLALASTIGLKHNISGWFNINIGKLNAESIRKLNEKQLKYLRKITFSNLMLAAIFTALISLIFILYGDADNAIFSLICCAIQFIIGMVSICPLIKKANLIKSEINMIIKENNAIQ